MAAAEVTALFTLAADKSGASIVWQRERKSAVYGANRTPSIAGDPLHGRDGDTGFLAAVDQRTPVG
jgi:hypothetical protein